MKISVLVANRNYAEYLKTAIDSALAQDYPDIEVIVVDDGSSDQSRKIIESYGDRITAIFGQFGGQIAATNVAWERCRGDIVLMLDSDDRLRSNTASLYAAKLVDSDYVKVSGYLRVIDSNGVPLNATIPRRLTPSGNYRQALIDSGPGAYRAAFNSGNGWTREFLQQVMPIPESSLLGPDGYLNLICPLFGPTASIDSWVAEYRVHGRNIGPVSRKFTVPWLQRMHAQLEASSIYLNEWIRRTDGPADAMNHWQRNWRTRLVRHCLARMTGQSGYRDSHWQMLVAPFQSVGTRPLRAVVLVPMLIAVICLPRQSAMSLSGRLLGFSKSHDDRARG